MENKYFVSICIPSYNRPDSLRRALDSIDTQRHIKDIQIVICEDYAPLRQEVRKTVEDFKKNTPYAIKYIENPVNLGHGGNWRNCSRQADGEYLIYMGDDDMFIPEQLDPFIDWLESHRDLGYVLRAYRSIDQKGDIEYFKYYRNDMFFEPGEKAYIQFFMKSNLMSGYTIKRNLANQFTEDCLDHTLYFQMYLMAEVCLKHPSGYCNIPIAQYVGDGIAYFGTNEKEKPFFTPTEKINNSYNNILSYFAITQYIDKKHGLNSTEKVKIEWSKYSSYSTLQVQRELGLREFRKCHRDLIDWGLNGSIYFNIYYFGLLILGVNFCQSFIKLFKKIYGSRPQL